MIQRDRTIPKNRLLIFACRRGRQRDIPLIRAGASAAGYRLLLLFVPLAYPVLIFAAFLRLLGADISLIISDRFVGDRWLARMFGKNCVRMLWNYADEFPACLQTKPDIRVCFFEDIQHPVQLFRFAPQPGIRISQKHARREVLFVGDVSTDCTLPQGLAWWQARLQELMQLHGYGFYLNEGYHTLLAANVASSSELRQVNVLTKNLLRLWIVAAARRHFGSRIVLVGSNWRKFNLEAASSEYSLESRMRLYASATVHLDCGSKSGDNSLYPRSSELISYVGAPLQVQCSDSAAVFGAYADEIVFANEETLCTLIADRLSETDARREERSVWLSDHLIRHRLTMENSFHNLFDANQAGSSHPPC